MKGITKKKFLIFLYLCAFILFIVYKSNFSKRNPQGTLLMQSPLPELVNPQQAKVILLWTNFLGHKWFHPSLGLNLETDTSEIFRLCNCPVRNCIFTHNRSDLYRSDALIFFHRDIHVKDLPSSH